MRCTSVVIADSHPVILQGLTSVLGARSGFKVVACCSDGPKCVEAIRSLTPDIAILDASMPGLTGLGNSRHRQFRKSCYESWCFSPHLTTTASWSRRLRSASTVSSRRDVSLELLVQSLRQIADGQRLLCLA